jgi:hypothetical protein
MPAQSPTNHYSSACFMLELGGSVVGFLRTVEGGEPVGQVVKDPVDTTGVIKKHISSVTYQPIVMTFGTGMDSVVYQWMADTLAHKPSTKSGAIIFGDYNYKQKLRLEFDDALITGIGFPALDTQSKDAAFVTLTLQPKVTRVNTASIGTSIQGFSTKFQKHWLASNFRLKISALETACAKVNAVDALTVTQDTSGGDRTGPVLTVPDLVFSVAENAAQDILNWVDDFLIKSKTAKTSERSGTLEFLDTSLKTVLFTLKLSNLGVIRAHRLRTEEQAGVIARIRVELYCEQMSFVPEKDVVGTATPSTSTPSPSSQGTTTSGPASIPLTDTLINIIAGRLTPETALQAALNVPGTSQIPAATAVSASEIVARRLLTTVLPVPIGPVVPKWDDGVALGEQWATDTATIDELNEIRTINQDDWSALKLGTGHSLVDKLRSQGMIPDGADGPLQLERDAFVEGLVAGAIQVLSRATPHLTRLSQEK